MEKQLISVLIPVYKVEKYIDRCLKSVINQTYQNLEILLVWQPSNDNTFEIIKKWEKIDSRIRIVEQIKPDLSTARNTLLKEAKSNIITFLDSDDMINNRFIEILFKELENNDADVVTSDIFAFKNENQIKKIQYNKIYKKQIYNNESYLYTSFSGRFGSSSGVSQAKLYRKKLFEDILFPNNRLSEDNATIYKVIWNARKIITVDLPLYYYQSNRSDSIMHNDNLKGKLIEAAIINRLEQYDFFSKKNKILTGITSYNILTERMRLLGSHSNELINNQLNLKLENNKFLYLKNALFSKNNLKIKLLSILCTFNTQLMYEIWIKRKTIKYNSEWRKK